MSSVKGKSFAQCVYMLWFNFLNFIFLCFWVYKWQCTCMVMNLTEQKLNHNMHINLGFF